MIAKALRIPAILLLGSCALVLTPLAFGHVATPTEDAVPEGLSKGDWASIRAAYEVGRHAVHSVAGGFEARNPGQGWRTHFDGRGFLTQPDTGGWTWGLELESYGFRGSEQEMTSPVRVNAEGGRVTYGSETFTSRPRSAAVALAHKAISLSATDSQNLLSSCLSNTGSLMSLPS